MISEITYNPITFKNLSCVKAQTQERVNFAQNSVPDLKGVPKTSVLNAPVTSLSEKDKEKYVYLLNFLKDLPKSPNSPDLTPFGQLNFLLKNGKLLSGSSHDNSTALDNLYSIATTERTAGLNSANLITNALDLLCNPRYVTQTFGDIPAEAQDKVLSHLSDKSPAKVNPEKMNVFASGTCAAASIEVNMADKYPAEFTRWISELSSAKRSIELNVDLDAISKNTLESIQILNLLEAKILDLDLKKSKVKVKINLDDSAIARACIQDKYWDRGERCVADVLVQSAVMILGSQNSYDTLTDTRAGKFNSNPQGLIELEKTFVESLIKNKEITSLVYQKIDDDQNLLGYNCSLDKIEKHITDTIDSGDDVILGYVLTNEMAGVTSNPKYNQSVDGKPNKVINGHEITVVDYYKDEKGKTVFVCIDTDDDSVDLVKYDADWLLPKIHHAGYPAHIVEADEAEIMKNIL